MRSPLDLIRGDFDHAIFTTYTIGLPFFERWVLPSLASVGVRNVVVLADEEMVGAALADPNVQLAGRAYHTYGIKSVGVFHPKLILLASPKQARLCVSSANLTVSGQLRNLETVAAFDTSIPGHAPVIRDGVEYLRRLVENVPPHVAEAVFDATSVFAFGDEHDSVAEFRHNLDRPLVEGMPPGLEAIAPYADKSGADRLAPKRLVVDGSVFSAPGDFFQADRPIDARQFERPLHGKAYRAGDGSWAMIGSPNLTSPGLLRSAGSGNDEAVVVFSDLGISFDFPESTSWGGEPVADAAPRRNAHRLEMDRVVAHGRFGSFASWEDDEAIAVDGVPDGTDVWHAHGTGFYPLANVVDGRVTFEAEIRPHLLRCEVGGTTLYSIVHRVTELRARRHRGRVTSRTRPLSGRLPLDPATQKVVEEVVGEFFALAALVGEDRARRARLPGASAPRPQEPEGGITEWIPADTADEPRIPDLYKRAWAERDSGDVLLALVRVALRLGEPDEIPQISGLDDAIVADEERGIDDVGDDPEDDIEKGVSDEETQLETTRLVLDRYRGSFMRRLGEVVQFIRSTDDLNLRDLAFQVVLTQQERLTIEVEVDGELLPLIEPSALLRQRLEILEAYLRGPSDDLRCLETARFHLASCLQERSFWTPREWERLEDLAYRHGTRILGAELPLRPLDMLFGMDAETAAVWIEELSARTDWSAIADHASELIEHVHLEKDPYPFIVGAAAFSEIWHAPGREGSPSWAVVGYGAVAGLADEAPFGVGIRNSGASGNFDMHVLVVEPANSRLFEMVRRRTDGRWMVRTYTPVGRRLLEDSGRLGPTVLSETSRTPWAETQVDDLPPSCRPPVQALLVPAAAD